LVATPAVDNRRPADTTLLATGGRSDGNANRFPLARPPLVRPTFTHRPRCRVFHIPATCDAEIAAAMRRSADPISIPPVESLPFQ
jgi:hypothetical protein